MMAVGVSDVPPPRPNCAASLASPFRLSRVSGATLQPPALPLAEGKVEGPLFSVEEFHAIMVAEYGFQAPLFSDEEFRALMLEYEAQAALFSPDEYLATVLAEDETQAPLLPVVAPCPDHQEHSKKRKPPSPPPSTDDAESRAPPSKRSKKSKRKPPPPPSTDNAESRAPPSKRSKKSKRKPPPPPSTDDAESRASPSKRSKKSKRKLPPPPQPSTDDAESRAHPSKRSKKSKRNPALPPSVDDAESRALPSKRSKTSKRKPPSRRTQNKMVATRTLNRRFRAPDPSRRRTVLRCQCKELPRGSPGCALHQAAPDRSWMTAQGHIPTVGGVGEVLVPKLSAHDRRGLVNQYRRWRSRVWMPSRFFVERAQEERALQDDCLMIAV